LIVAVALLALLSWLFDIPGRWCQMAAERALKRNCPQVALQWLERARAIGNSPAATDLIEARAYARAGLSARAMQSLTSAIEQVGADEDLVAACRDILLARRGDVDAAERLTNMRPGLLPTPEVYEAATRCAMYHGNWDWARSVIDSWEKAHPDDALADYFRGRLWEIQDIGEKAIPDYDAALQQQSDLVRAAFRQGAVLRDLRRYDEAIEYFQRCRDSHFAPIAMIEVANCLWQQGDSDEAWQVIEPYVDIPLPQLMDLYLQAEELVDEDRAAVVAGRIRSSQDSELSVPYLERALRFNRRNIEARKMLVAAYREQGDDEAAAEQTTIVEQLLEKRRQTADLRRLLADKPDDLEMRCDLAELYLEAESLLHAQLELTTVLDQSPEHLRAHRLLAKVYREKARYAPEFSGLAEYHDNFTK
jgi:tetratricopeptide (TPR) repeat protein